MKASAIRGLRSLTSKIHPPLPLSPRESQRLLSLLNASFRQQLDREHPYDSVNKMGVTDAHFRSIFSSPLFTNSHVRPQPSASLKSYQPGSSFEQVQHLVSNPIEQFRQQVADGAATLETAKQCLRSCRTDWMTLQQDETNKAHGLPKVCRPILHWLWSRGSYQTLDFLEDKSFLSLLTPFIVLEGRKQVIWQWLERLNDAIRYLSVGGETVPAQVLTQATLINLYMKSIIQHGGGFGEALTEFLTIVNKASVWAYPQSSWIHSVFTPARKSLTLLFTKKIATSKCNADEYNAFIGSLDVWGHPATIPYLNALLPLHHPLNPDAAPSLRYLRTRRLTALEISGPYTRGRIVALGFDTAQVLLLSGRPTDASWVIRFLQDNFAKEIGYGQRLHATDTFAKSKDIATETPETTNLRLLEQLAVD